MNRDPSAARTQMTPEILKESVKILETIMDVCNACVEENRYWSEACRERHLDPLKTRQMILRNLGKCTGFDLPLENFKLADIYDGYEKFYQTVFGDSVIKEHVLPFDYRESVVHVIKNTGLLDKETFVLMRHFGIGDYEIPVTMETIGEDLHVTKSRISYYEKNAIGKCRLKDRIEILQLGLAKYNMRKMQMEEEHRKQLEQFQAEHNALMEKYDAEHRKHMETIASNSYEQAVLKILPMDIMDKLAETDIKVLGLSIRPYNALRRSYYYTLFDLLRVRNREDFLKIPHMGNHSVDEVVEKLSLYIRNTYNVDINLLRKFYPDQMKGKL